MTSPIPGLRYPRPYGVGPHAHHSVTDGGPLDAASIGNAALGSGTPDTTKFLRGDRTWAAPGGGSPVSPIASPNGWYKADALALNDGDPVGTWVDGGSAAMDLTAAGAVRPTYKAQDDGDGLPYIDFDGTDDLLLKDNSSVAIHSGTTITVYGVFKVTGQDNDGLSGFSRSVGFDTNFDGGFILRSDTGYFYVTRNAVNYIPVAANVGASGYIPDFRTWQPFCLRWKLLNGRAVVTIHYGNAVHSIDLGGTVLPAFAFSVICAGGRFSGGGGTNYAKCQWRELLWYSDSHSDSEVKHNLSYLAGKWKCPVWAG